MPARIGQGLRKRAASRMARSWVLSPISAMATRTVETRKASKRQVLGRARTRTANARRRPAARLAVGLAEAGWFRPACAMPGRASMLTQAPLVVADGYSPRDGGDLAAR